MYKNDNQLTLTQIYQLQEQFYNFCMFADRRRSNYFQKGNDISEGSISTDTCDSPRQLEPTKKKYQAKEKLELCKKFSEFGYCPYQKKCRFAHGFHELRKNNNVNCRYKTKECVTYCEDGTCRYGSRCNFIHPSKQQTLSIKHDFQEVKQFAKRESRVLTMLSIFNK